jgi:ABC-type sugar transport system ATPase subunit
MSALSFHDPVEQVLEIRALSKNYGRVEVLIDISLSLFSGEILAIVGDNGAGKSTLLKCVTGTISPDGGVIRLRDKEFLSLSPRKSMAEGVSAVYQDLALVEELDVATNLFLGAEPLRAGFLVDRARMHAEAGRRLKELGIDLPSTRARIADLSGGQRQAVAIARAVMQVSGKNRAGIVILDEPTAAMGVRESELVLGIIRGLRERKMAVLFVSHNLPQVFRVADRLCVLRSGKMLWCGKIRDVSIHDVIAMMSGSPSLIEEKTESTGDE